MESLQAMLERMPKGSFRMIESTTPRQMQAGLLFLVGLFLLKKASNRLSLWAHNNYVSDKTWDWGKELVVITGGSSGIGAQIVSKLAAKNVKVVIFDVVEPNGNLGGFLDWKASTTFRISSLTNFQLRIASSTR